MMKRLPHNLCTPLAAVLLAALLLASCRPSAREQMEALEAQKKQWVAEIDEAFPERTTDTVELRRRLEYYRGTGNGIGQMMMYRVLGNEARNSSQFRAAIEYHTAGLEIAYRLRDTINISVVTNDLATDFRRIGAFDEAAPYHYAALELTEAYRGPDTLLNERNMASAYNGIGSVCRAMNEFDEALRVYRLALELEAKHNNHRGMAINYANIGAIYFDRGEFAAAEENYAVSLEHNERAGLPMGIALCRINIGRIHEAQGRLDDALSEFLRAYDIMAGTPDRWHWLDACFQVAYIHTRQGEYARAERYLTEGMSAAREIGSLKHILKAHELYSELHYARGDWRRAVEDTRAAKVYADSMQRSLQVDRLLESRVKYETSKYAAQIEELDERNVRQTARRRVYTLVTVPVILLLAGLLMMLHYRRRLERRAAAAAKELERMRSNFFTNITHEFRTPVTVIHGLADHLRRAVDGGGSPDMNDLDAIRRQSQRLMHLVEQLLEFARSEAGAQRPRWRQGDIAEYLRVTAEPYVRYARSKGVEMFVYCEEESLRMNFVPSSVQKVVGNLLSNAIRHTPAGGRIAVHLRRDRAANRCVIQVRDNGEGIPADRLPHIFELYYTSRADGMGSGIGLALSKQLVEETGGTISVESAPGRGTVFTVSRPISLDEIPGDGREETPASVDATLSEGSEALASVDATFSERSEAPASGDAAVPGAVRPVVLVVEDNRDVAHYISTVLGGRYRLLHAANGAEGLEMAEQYIPDLVITDVMMPVKDGCAFTAELRGSAAISHIPVIMLTALAETEDKLAGLGAGADAYLPKPFDERELPAQIDRLLDSRARLRETYSGLIARGAADAAAAAVAAEAGDPNSRFLLQFHALVNGHLADDSYFPDGLAGDLCMSRSQLDRKIKAMTGRTTSSFVMQIRLYTAHERLSKGTMNVTETAHFCGFYDLAHFSRSFKAEFGVSPSQFVKPADGKTIKP